MEAYSQDGRKKFNEAFLKLRSCQVYQQCVLLGLLNRHFEITIHIPSKRSIVTRQFFKVHEIRNGSDCIKVDEYVEQRCKEKYEKDISNGVSEKTARRRLDTNKITEQIHLYIDILTDLGYVFHSKYTSGKKGAQIVESVQQITTPNEIITQIQIPLIGAKANDYFTEQLFTQKRSIFAKNDLGLSEVIHNSEDAE